MAFLNAVSLLANTLTLLTDTVIEAAEAAGASVAMPGGLWSVLILKLFNIILNYGVRVVVFTLLLKVLLSPLDIFQRVKARKNQKITERLKPEIEKLQKQYPDKTVFAQKQMQLNRREGYSYVSSCLPAIATMVIFITLLVGLNKISRYMNFKEYYELYTVYSIVEMDTQSDIVYDKMNDAEKAAFDAANEAEKAALYSEKYDSLEITERNEVTSRAKSEGQKAVADYYETHRQGFLWITNIWAPDVPWKKSVNSEDEWKKNAGDYWKKASFSGLSNDELGVAVGKYKDVVGDKDRPNENSLFNSDYNQRNGYLILPLLALGLSIGQQFLTRRQQKQTGQMNAGGMMGGNTMKMMMWIMPIMIGVFALQYTAAFALYLAVNYTVTIGIMLTANFIFFLTDKNEKNKLETEVQKYGRPDPKDL